MYVPFNQQAAASIQDPSGQNRSAEKTLGYLPDPARFRALPGTPKRLHQYLGVPCTWYYMGFTADDGSTPRGASKRFCSPKRFQARGN